MLFIKPSTRLRKRQEAGNAGGEEGHRSGIREPGTGNRGKGRRDAHTPTEKAKKAKKAANAFPMAYIRACARPAFSVSVLISFFLCVCVVGAPKTRVCVSLCVCVCENLALADGSVWPKRGRRQQAGGWGEGDDS